MSNSDEAISVSLASRAQRRMYFLEEMAAGAPTYHTPVCYRLEGEVDEAALLTAAQRLVDRHEALRTRFAVRDGELVQLIRSAEHLTWTAQDVRSDDEADQWIRDQCSRPFDLLNGPLFRVALLRRSNAERVLLLNTHHIIVDGWSLRIILKELTRGYELALAGLPDDQEPPAFQYADYSDWQEDWLRSSSAERQEAYWRTQLAGDLPIVAHPAFRKQASATGSLPSAVHRFSLPGNAMRKVADLCACSNTTVFTGLLAAFDVLLSRYTGIDDIVVGVPVANRHHEEFENTVGLFANTTVIRADLSRDPTFMELMTTMRETVLDAQENQDIPFEKLVDLKGVPQGIGTPPIFQVMFAMHHGRDQSWVLPGVRVTELTLEVNTAKFDLLFDAVQTEDGVDCSIEYRPDVLTSETIALFAEHYCRLVDSIADNPDMQVSRLRFLTTAEYERWVPEPVAPIETSQKCHELFSEWARQTPDAPAVTFRNEDISYAELEREANRIANFLRSLGVGPDVLVGLSVDRSPDLIIGILGILKAGGCYVPLDPSYPAERLQYMAEDSGIEIMLVNDAAAPRWASFTGSVLNFTRDAERIASWPDSSPAPCGSLDDLAYVIYTSGSTGHPKGVLVPHRNITRLFSSTQPWFEFDRDDVWTLFHSYAFDFSVWEMWGALTHGGRLVVVDYETSRTPSAFHQLVRDQRVTVLNQTPSAFTQFSQADANGEGPAERLSLRYIVFGGEALEPSSLRDWFTRHGDSVPRLVNMYGITETTVHVTYRPITLRDLDAERGSVIGIAIPDLRLYVLDRRSQPVPTGATGELHIGGAGLARGYLNRPDLTAERFIQNPFTPQIPDRLYRSGDLVSIHPDGELEYRGRIDDQVKLRGFRIELGEIEAALIEHASVSGAVVLLRHDVTAHPYLAAYVVRSPTSPGGEPLGDMLREHLAGRLPEYMVPAVFSELSALPLTANGKVDKGRLPDPHRSVAAISRPYAAPRTATERELANIWSRTLGQPRVGIDDTYHSLGGDSIRSIQVMAAAREVGLEFSLTDLLGRQTIRRLAEVTASPGPAPSPRAEREPFGLLRESDRTLLPDGIEDAYPMTQLQLGMVFHSDLSASVTSQYHNVWYYRLRAPYSEDAWRTAVAAACQRHEILRTSFALDGFSEPMQLVHRQVDTPVTFEDLRQVPETKRSEAATSRFEAETSTPFSWTRPPLVRFHVQRLTDETFHLFVVEHHAILDGWSERSLFVELLTRYIDATAGQAFRPDNRLSYRFRDFVELERAAAADADSARFWSKSLDGFSFSPIMGPTRAGEADKHSRMAFSYRAVPADLALAVQRLAERLEVPLRTLLMAAHLRVMSVVGGTRDVVTGAVYNGRGEARDADKCLGLFLNTLPVRMLIENGTWRELIQQTARLDHEIQPHRRYPMSEIMRRAGQRELFDTYFNYTHFHVERSLADQAGIEVLDSGGVGSTSFSFGASFNVDSTSGELIFAMRYDAEQFDSEQIEALRSRYESALAQMADSPDSRYASAGLLSAAERRAIEAWSVAAPVPTASAATLTGLFGIAAREQPHGMALVRGGESINYRQLDARSTRLARILQRGGVAPERLVAVCLEDSIDLIVAILAVLKAGGAYVPLDPAQPPARIESVLADADPLLLLTDRKHSILLDGYAGERMLIDDISDLSGTGQDEPPLPETAGRDHLAYVIYTSGSTGRPKGVAVEHGEIVTYLAGMRERLDVLPGAVYGLSQSLAFDFSMTMLYLSLTTGGTLCLLPRHLTGDELATAVKGSGIDYLKMTPSHLSALAADIAVERLLPRRALLLGGEASSADWSADLAGRGNCAVFNHYGPTEATVGMTVHQITADHRYSASTPIGRPFPGARLYVLDSYMQMVPPGTAGELYLGGERLARGYLGRAALTAERFVADPFDPAGARLYRSGDLARWLPNGSLEFLGRRDHQVKIHGHRVELGEIEAALREVPGIAQAVAVAHPADIPRHLIAYLEPAPGTSLGDLRELRCHLQRRLPEHMVPFQFVTLDRLPRQSHGKIDRKALPAPDTVLAAPGEAREAPATHWEQTIAGMWSELLGVDEVSAIDDFFELGGNSLLATRMAARLRQALPNDIATVRVRDLFTHRTIRSLSALVEELNAGCDPRQVAVADLHQRQFLPSVRQQGLWFLSQEQGPSSAYNAPTAVWLTGALDREALRLAISDVVARHETLRCLFESRQGTPYLRVLDPAEVEVELPLVPVAAAEVPGALARLCDVPFDLAMDPPFRAYLLRVDADRHLMLLVIHHVATDGVSRGVLYRDLSTAYAARHEGREPDWEPLPMRYVDYAIRQREFLGNPAESDSEAARQLAYWKKALAGLPEEVVLRADRLRPASQSHQGVTYRVTCPPDVQARLLELARQTGTTLFMLVQAATATLLTRLGAGHDVAIGVPVDGREGGSLEGLIGFFVNTVVLRTSTHGTPSFRELLQRVRETDIAAWEHQDIPFDWVVEALNPERSASRNPLFQVLMTVEERGAESLQLPGLATQIERVDTGTTKFDLAFGFAPHQAQAGAPGELLVTVEGSADLYEAQTIRTLAELMALLLDSVARDPDVSITDIELLTAQARERLRTERIGQIGDKPAASPLELFEAQVARQPQAIAVVSGTERVTYGALNTMADQLAHALAAQDVRSESPVAVLAGRSVGLAVAMVGVLKSGATCIPIDPAYSAQHIATLLTEVKPSLIVVDPATTGALQQDLDVPLVVLGQPASELAGSTKDWSDFPRRAPRLAAHEAYVVRTSYSAGSPVAVAMTDGSVAATLQAVADLFGLGSDDVWAWSHSPESALSVLETWGSLASGGALVVCPEAGRDPQELRRLLEQERVTVLCQAPSAIKSLIHEDAKLPAELALRIVMLVEDGVDAGGMDTLAAWRATDTQLAVWMYGASDAVCLMACAPPGSTRLAGLPTPGAQAFVLDPALRLLPAGVVGELYMADAQLARGYSRRPGLTAERFVACPFEPGRRMFRTGYLARWGKEGRLEYVGRVDEQVQLRGIPVDLGKLRAMLACHPKVAQAAVTVHTEKSGRKQLVAYSVPIDDTVTAAELDVYLRDRLAGHLVPATVVLDEIPRARDGQLDQRALPAHTTAREAYRHGASTRLGKELCAVMAEVLEVPEITADDNFFALGGHSLLAVRYLERINHILNVGWAKLTIRDLYRYPTVAQLSERLNTQVRSSPMEPVLTMREGPGEPIFCMPSISGLSWAFSGILPHIDASHPVIGLQSGQLLAPHARPRDFDQLVNAHVARIREVRSHGPFHLVGWSFGGVLAHMVAVRLESLGEQVATLALLDARPLPERHSTTADRKWALSVLLGREANELPEPATDEHLVELLRANEPVLGTLDQNQVAAIVSTTMDNGNAFLHYHVRDQFSGNMLFFNAKRARNLTGNQAWAPYVRGDILEYEVDCEHMEMTQREPLAEIGKILNQYLRPRPF